LLASAWAGCDVKVCLRGEEFIAFTTIVENADCFYFIRNILFSWVSPALIIMPLLVFVFVLLLGTQLTQLLLFTPLDVAQRLSVPQGVLVVVLVTLFAWLFGE
jgi:hypothetical protein